MARLVRLSSGLAWLGMARRGSHVGACPGMAVRGMACRVLAGLGRVRRGEAWQSRNGESRRVLAWPGAAWSGEAVGAVLVRARWGEVCCVMVWQSCRVGARYGMAGRGTDRSGMARQLWHVQLSRVQASFGLAWRVLARSGEAGMVTLEVRAVPPSPNELRRKFRNPHAYKKLRGAWEWALLGSLGPHHRQALILLAKTAPKLRVQITFHHSREFDPDNLGGTQKIILDALTNIHFLAGDSAKEIELLPAAQVKCMRKDQKTVIKIGVANGET